MLCFNALWAYFSQQQICMKYDGDRQTFSRINYVAHIWYANLLSKK